MTTMGLVHNFGGLMTARWFLGLAEAGLFPGTKNTPEPGQSVFNIYPGVNYYLSCWYKRSEFGIRAAIFFSAAALAGSFGGLLAAAIENMDGVGGKPGWAWIFILEGLATIVIAALSFFMVHDFPDEAKFLTEDDRRRVIRRLKLDKQSSAEHEEFKMEYFWAALMDWKTYTGMIVYMGCDGALYAFSLFLPTIVEQMGYKSIHAQLLSGATLCCRRRHYGSRGIRGGPNGQKRSVLPAHKLSRANVLLNRVLQYVHGLIRHHWFCHASGLWSSTRPICWCLPGCHGHLPMYSEHDLVDCEQYRGSLQTWNCSGFCDRMGQLERYILPLSLMPSKTSFPEQATRQRLAPM